MGEPADATFQKTCFSENEVKVRSYARARGGPTFRPIRTPAFSDLRIQSMAIPVLFLKQRNNATFEARPAPYDADGCCVVASGFSEEGQ